MDSESESDYEDENVESNEIDNDLIMDREDQDILKPTSSDEIKTNDMNFKSMRIFDTINPLLSDSYFRIQIKHKIKFLLKQTACWLLTDKASRLSADRLLRVTETYKRD